MPSMASNVENSWQRHVYNAQETLKENATGLRNLWATRKAYIVAIVILVQIWAIKLIVQMPQTSLTKIKEQSLETEWDDDGFEHSTDPLVKSNGTVVHSSSHKSPNGTAETNHISVPWNDPNRPLVTYAYHETDKARENMKFFIEKGLNSAADFIFIINGESNDTALIPPLPNIRIVNRSNECFDLGSIGEVLRKDDLWRRYRKFITLNASLRGPFLPTWGMDRCWMDLFLNRLNNKTKLVGTSANCQPQPHIQSMLFALDSFGMELMLGLRFPDGSTVDAEMERMQALDPGLDDDEVLQAVREDVRTSMASQFGPSGFQTCYDTMSDAVKGEVGSTAMIKSAGFEVDAMLTSLHGYDSIDTYCRTEKDAFHDVNWNYKYYGFNVHPYEVVFFKANRDVDPKMLAFMTRWHRQRGDGSWDSCK